MPRATGGLLERLELGPVVGDGGLKFVMERRGYVEAGRIWTSNAPLEHPEAVRQLHREFLRAGSDVCQAFTFNTTGDHNEHSGNTDKEVYDLNNAACKIVKEVAYAEGSLVAGTVTQTDLTYKTTRNKEAVQNELTKMHLDVFKEHQVDLMICEEFEHVEEAIWHLERIKDEMLGVPVCVSLCIDEQGDGDGVQVGECGIRLARAGADVVGVGGRCDPFRSLDIAKTMIASVKKAGFDKVHFMTQPLGFLIPETEIKGFDDLPEYPFAVESRICTRFEISKYARDAYDAGIRFIGGSSGFEPYHIRQISETFIEERGGYEPPGCIHWGKVLEKNVYAKVRARQGKDYWGKQTPCTGRPYSSPMSKIPNRIISAGNF